MPVSARGCLPDPSLLQKSLRYPALAWLERPDLQAVDGVAHIHRQVDGLEGLGIVEVVDRDGRGGGASGEQTVAEAAPAASTRLAGVTQGDVSVEELGLIIVLDGERDARSVRS